MLKKLILGVLAVVVLLVIVLAVLISRQPDTFTVTRSATFNAPPDRVYAQVNDFKNWPAWSPWERLDPSMQKTVSQPSAGKGATYAWTGNDEVGQGKMTIIDGRPSEAVNIDLEFIKPFSMKSRTDFSFKPEGDKTTMTWAMTGEHNFMTKAMSLFANMDAMVGSDFDKGLANLKPVVEAPAAQ